MVCRRTMLCRLLCGVSAAAAQARTRCTVIADAKTGQIKSQRCDCAERDTPAFTFKIAISLMGYDSAFSKTNIRRRCLVAKATSIGVVQHGSNQPIPNDGSGIRLSGFRSR